MRVSEFRGVNARNNQIDELQATVVLSRMQEHHGKRSRKFQEFQLERSSVKVFPLQSMVVHPIDEASLLRDVTPQQLAEPDAEFIILPFGIERDTQTLTYVRLDAGIASQ